MGLDVELLDIPKEEVVVYDTYVTHNLGLMAKEAGIYMACWRPEEINATKAKDIISILEEGLKKLKDNPDHYKQFNPSNKWGDYDGFVKWVEKYLQACKEHPEARIIVDR